MMTFARALGAIGLTALVSACGGSATSISSTDFTTSDFATSNSGVIAKSVDTTYRSGSRSLVTANANGGFGYLLGFEDANGVVAYAGVDTTTTVDTPPASGTATMTGSYRMAVGTNLQRSGNLVTGFTSTQSGSMTVNVDFGANSLNGSSTGGTLTVNGTFVGSDVTGTATYSGVNGNMQGKIGSDAVIGAFHGNGATSTGNQIIYAGGFTASK